MKKAEAIILEDVDRVNLDINFVAGVIDALFTISGAAAGIESLKNSTVAVLCGEAAIRAENVKKFIGSVSMIERKEQKCLCDPGYGMPKCPVHSPGAVEE